VAQRVWIIGAGFSKSLGGPLMSDLLRPEVPAKLQAAYPQREFPRLAQNIVHSVTAVYAHGTRYFDGKVRSSDVGEWLWDDAEQFLDYVDSALWGGPESAAFKTLDRVLHMIRREQDAFSNKSNPIHAAAVFSAAARRLVAGSCSAFLRGADLNSERWEPYVFWARQLSRDDTLITFNYDVVPELLAAKTDTLAVVMPGSSRPTNKAAVLKLHGSVNWCLRAAERVPIMSLTGAESVAFEAREDPDFALRCEDDEIAIAGPGPRKRIMANWLNALWTEALQAIRNAEAVFFLGYRFPPSDAQARKKILDELRSNTRDYLGVQTILAGSGDTDRLIRLLRFSLHERHERGTPKYDQEKRDFNLLAHPLYVEDYLSTVPMGLAEEPWRMPH